MKVDKNTAYKALRGHRGHVKGKTMVGHTRKRENVPEGPL